MLRRVRGRPGTGARHRRRPGLSNVRFEPGSAYAIGAADASFDVVHAHQVLLHLTDPVAALRELLRVTRPHGVVAVRDCDYGGAFWWPTDPRLELWRQVYHAVARDNGSEPDAWFAIPHGENVRRVAGAAA